MTVYEWLHSWWALAYIGIPVVALWLYNMFIERNS